jgi:hypothetical protein
MDDMEDTMRTTNRSLETTRGRSRCMSTAVVIAVVLLAGGARATAAAETGPKTFSTAADAAQALFQAVQTEDDAALKAILGEDLVSSGDESEDKLERQRFTEKYEQMHRFVSELDGTTVLYVGAENWPFPVPLVSEKGRWRFDSDAGRQEVALRRIGHNETTAIRVCDALAAKRKQSETQPTSDDPIVRYAERLASAHRADADGPTSTIPQPETFDGYVFRVVPKPAGGPAQKPRSDVSVVAYPEEYRITGVMTFIVTDDDRVYERDLGPGTVKDARRLETRPASGWSAVSRPPSSG